VKAVIQALRDQQKFIIMSHEHPDPDSIGSMLGLYLGLQQLGKSCRMVSADPPPAALDWHGLAELEVMPGPLDITDAWVVVLDCEPSRTRLLSEELTASGRIINIDHHQGSRFASGITWVDPDEPATSVMVYRILKALGVSLNPWIATALYGGIVGDTGGFRYANTTAEVFTIAAELVAQGIDHPKIARQIFSCKPMEFMKLLGHALSTMESDLDGRLVWLKVSYADFLRWGADPAETDQLIQYARMVDTARIALLFREVKPGEIRVGFRSDAIDVAKLAAQFGGGGHKLAAGAKFTGTLDAAVEQVTAAARAYIYEEDRQWTASSM